MENDSEYVKSVLARVRKHRSRNMQLLYMFIREHYEPESWKKWGELESMQAQLADWRHNTAEGTIEAGNKAAVQLATVAAEFNGGAARVIARATTATAREVWIAATAARANATSTRISTSGPWDGAATVEPQHKKAKM